MEYALADQQPPHLYVIRKLFRHPDGTSTSDLAYYYILDGSIYQAPSIHAALSSRMVSRRKCAPHHPALLCPALALACSTLALSSAQGLSSVGPPCAHAATLRVWSKGCS